MTDRKCIDRQDNDSFYRVKEEHGDLYWSNTYGWTTRTEADIFNKLERDTYQIAAMPGVWEPIDEDF